MSQTTHSRLHITSRVGAALLGGYAFTWGTIVLVAALMVAAGAEFHDAEHLAYLVGMLVFLIAFLAAFAARSLRRAWIVLAGGGALMAAGASLLQSQLV